MKKRYGKVFAFFLFDFSTGSVEFIFWAILFIIGGNTSMGIMYIIMEIISVLMTFFMTKSLNKRTPKDERVGTWFRAWWLGVRVTFKIALCFTLILIPKMMSWHLSVSDQDVYTPHWYDMRKKVRDDNGNEYQVGRSGDYVKDKSGNWHKVSRFNNGDPYIIGNGSDKINLS